MTDSSDREGSSRCELHSSGGAHGASPCTDRVLSADEYTRCSNCAAGRFRLRPDYGAEIVVWLCAAHREAYDERIVETLVER